MKELGITPGPWFAEESPSRKFMSSVQFEYLSGERGTVCLVGASEPDEQNANARLIASSPTLAAYVQRKADEGDKEARRIMETIHARS